MTNIPIFLSADNNYAPFVATTIASICDNTKSFCNFYILDGGITEENQEKICALKEQFNNFSIEFIKIDHSKYFKNYNYVNYTSVSTYDRLLIPYIKQNIDYALYSDVDVIVLGDILEMYKENLEEYIIGAVWEKYAENLFDRKSKLKISKTHRFFYAGNLKINCKKWREEKVTEKIFELETKVRDKLQLADMDLLNKYFENNNYKELPNKYCYLNEDDIILNNRPDKIIIRHFAGAIKPWQADFYIFDKKPYKINNSEEFWKYAKMTLFYDTIIEKKEQFLNSNILYQRFNKLVNMEKK